ncbi:phage tail assembly protein [Wolbachia endosymbiont of Cylisticus convexus]|uniref:phage tail assembly protein n=1 Tax=Wolbachia endosymbiont of Cylisticus convexus TaxID=118728 RepID=UPI000DF6C624|nr:phage tail assembly protein [Wolbachia endosymbiont of Cylisticus convexus]RDD35487.1 phage tail assembly protein [Wolbachia endosymbiont of Cylisticus convexus]
MQKIKLTEPIKIDGILVSELTLRRPKVRDRLAVERMGNSDAEKEVALIANLASISREAVEELDLADYGKIQATLQDFLSQQKI